MFQLPFNFKQQKPLSSFLIIDIGSTDVKVILFKLSNPELSPHTKASAIGAVKKIIPIESIRSGTLVNQENIISVLKDAISEVVPEGENVKDVIFGVSGVLGTGFMITVKINRKSQGPISSKELNDHFEKIHEEAYGIAQSIFHDMTGEEEMDIKMVISSVVYSKIDGGIVEDLEGKTGRKLEVAVYTAFTPTYHFNALNQITNKLGLSMVAIAPTTYSLTKALAFSKGKDFDGVVVDVGGELTDVGVVFSGGIVASRSIEVGGNHFTRALEKGLSLAAMDAERQKISYSFGRLNESEEMLVQGYIDSLLDTWLNGLEVVFSDFNGVKMFSSNVYVVGGGMLLPDLFDVLTKEPWTRSIPFKSPPEFSKLSLADLKLVEDMTGSLHSLEYIVPASLAIVYLEAKGLID